MRWELKAFLQAAISQLPFHSSIYRSMHSTLGRGARSLGDQLDRKFRLLKRMRENGLDIEGRFIVEIGTGWHPVCPLLFAMLGARRVLTLDVNPWLTARTLRVTVDGIDRGLDPIAAELGVPAERLRSRLDAVKQAIGNRRATPTEALAACGIEYRMPGDARATDLPDQSVDYVISANVLEHVPSDIIAGLLTESRRILRPDGRLYHHINPGDHFAEDPRISTVHFLRYSPRAWYRIGGSGVAYHNRLRGADYVRMVGSAGFEITGIYENVDPRALQELGSGVARLHPDYAHYTPEQLACDVIGIFARPAAERPVAAAHDGSLS